MKRIDLNGEYLLYTYDHQTAPDHPQQLWGESILAQVPGNVELDYQRAGIFQDLLYGQNFRQAETLEWKDFWYVRQFSLDEDPTGKNVQLCFEGVDTIADYYLNGVRIGSSDNMFIGWHFPVGDALQKGENTLAVHIHSAVAHARQYTIGPYNVAFPGCYEGLSVRKCQMNYGWDISPRLLSAGIWREVYLEFPDEIRFRDVYVTTAEVREDLAVLVVSCNAVIPEAYIGKCQLHIAGTCGDHRWSAQYPLPYLSTTVYPYVRDARLWNPLGMGEQNLYDITLQIVSDGQVLAQHRLRYGIRTAKLHFGEEIGETGDFALYVNSQKVRCKGANWVPMSLLHSQDKKLYQETLKALRDANCNMVRVWGGGVYEDDTFFDLCDQYGIMVWQDIMLSCHAYPMTEDFYQTMYRECEAVAKRIRNHPSLVLYCGGNETDWSYVCVGLDPNDDRISREAIPRALYQQDPYRSYLPSTPYFSRKFVRENGGRFYLDRPEIIRQRVSLPQEHYWWHREDFLAVREQAHKFITEIGYSGASQRESLDAYLPEGYRFDDDSAWENHAYPTEGKRQTGILYLFENLPQDDDAKILASQHYQAEAYKFIIELCRIRPENNGILLWTVRENWPSYSSALVDYYGRRKITLDAVRLANEPLQCIVDIYDGRAECYLVNDRMDSRCVSVDVTDETGKKVLSAQVKLEEGVSVMKLASIPLEKEQLLLTSVRAGADTVCNYRFVYTDKIDYPLYRQLYQTKFGQL